MTHEEFIGQVRDIAVSRLEDSEGKARVMFAKLVYGVAGTQNAYGACYYNGWNKEHPVVEIAARYEIDGRQLAVTTLHELGHVLAGRGQGHSKEWQAACMMLGLNDAKAVGYNANDDNIAPDVRDRIAALGEPSDGKPTLGYERKAPDVPRKGGGCGEGIGTRGGKSRGKGSGSRLRLWICECAVAVKVRVASDTFNATCGDCNRAFKRKERGGE